MKLGFEESQSPNGSQNARAWTEAWVSAWVYCPHCGNAKISSFPNDSPLADFVRTYPSNQNVKPTIRQQLQYLRDQGFIDFVSRGNYRPRS